MFDFIMLLFLIFLWHISSEQLSTSAQPATTQFLTVLPAASTTSTISTITVSTTAVTTESNALITSSAVKPAASTKSTTTTTTSTDAKTFSSASKESQNKPAAASASTIKERTSSIRMRPKPSHSPKLPCIPTLTISSNGGKDEAREKLVDVTSRKKEKG